MDLTILSRQKVIILRLSLSFTFIEGLFVLWNYLAAPSEAETVVFLQYSTLRLALLLVVFLSVLAILPLLGATFKSNWNDGKLGKFVDSLWDRQIIFWILLALGGLTYFLLFASPQILGPFASYRERLHSILVWFALIVIQFTVSSFFIKGRDARLFQRYRSSLVPSGVALLLLVLFLAFVALTKLGLTPDADYWQGPGVPLLFYQVIIAWLIGMSLFSVKNILDFQLPFKLKPFAEKYRESIICLILWTLAFTAWASYPVKPSYGSLSPTPPNFQSYPFGDALLFDINAQAYWIGIPIPNDFWEKPFYSFFLAVLHGIAGQDYELLVRLQVAVFALNPVLLYLIVRLLVNRPAGLIAGTLLIFREINALALSNVVLVSHSKLLMSDIFAMGLVLLLTLCLLFWARKPGQHRSMPLVIGGVFGALVLTRGHALLLLPFIGAAIWLLNTQKDRLRSLLEPALLSGLGLFLVLGGWVWRSYEMTGKISFQNPISTYTTQIARLYSLNPTENPARLPGEDDEAYYNRIKSQPLEFLLAHPLEVARFVSAHSFHNLIFSYLYLPQSAQIETPVEFVKESPFWSAWEGALPNESKGFLALNLVLLSVGIAVAWKSSRRLSLIPLFLFVGYNLSVSIGRLSGWRLIQPVDWVTLVFYSAGLVQFGKIIRSVYTEKERSPKNDNPDAATEKSPVGALNWGWIIVISLLFAAISWGVTQGHVLSKPRYPELTTEVLILEYEKLSTALNLEISADDLQEFAHSDDFVAYYGRGLYPSYLPVEQGELNYFFLEFAPRPYKRLVFHLIGPSEIGVVLPMKNRPEYFPSAADVMAFGCFTQNQFISDLPGYVDALLVVVKLDPPIIYTRDPMPELTCPLDEPDTP
ncbi:MAG: glycosyltransferase family 39 protein [Anaerolineales bacterium]|nr:glycosyltransferase family 39 protein [Anaerolineales bacterium]